MRRQSLCCQVRNGQKTRQTHYCELSQNAPKNFLHLSVVLQTTSKALAPLLFLSRNNLELTNVDTDKVEITSIDFKSVNGENTVSDMTYKIANGVAIFTASVPGEYTVKCKPKGSNVWTDGSTVVKEYK